MRGWAGRVAVVVVVSMVAAIGTVLPAGAAKAPNPCKLLKAGEIEDVFGASVSAPKPGTKTAATVECTWDVAAGSTLPEGTVTARVMFVGGKAAYDGLKKMPDFVPVAGLKRSLWQEKTGALNVLDGANLLTVQGVFLEGPPIRSVNVQEQLIPLVKLVQKRA